MSTPFFDYERRVVSLLGRIEASDINRLADQLLRLENENSEPITLYVSSIGGDLVEAFKILDVLGSLDSRVTTIAMGLVQAAGVLIFAAAPERLMLPTALLSTHHLWAMPELEEPPLSGFGSSRLQPRDELRAKLEARVDTLSSPGLSQLILEAATVPKLFTAEQAVVHGLADGLVPARKVIESPNTELIHHVR